MPHKSRLNTLPGAIPLLEHYRLGVVWGRVARMHNENALYATFDGGEKSSLCLSFPAEHEKE